MHTCVRLCLLWDVDSGTQKGFSLVCSKGQAWHLHSIVFFFNNLIFQLRTISALPGPMISFYIIQYSLRNSKQEFMTPLKCQGQWLTAEKSLSNAQQNASKQQNQKGVFQLNSSFLLPRGGKGGNTSVFFRNNLFILGLICVPYLTLFSDLEEGCNTLFFFFFFINTQFLSRRSDVCDSSLQKLLISAIYQASYASFLMGTQHGSDRVFQFTSLALFPPNPYRVKQLLRTAVFIHASVTSPADSRCMRPRAYEKTGQ